MKRKIYVDGDHVGYEEVEDAEELASSGDEEQGGPSQEPGDSSGGQDPGEQDSEGSESTGQAG